MTNQTLGVCCFPKGYKRDKKLENDRKTEIDEDEGKGE